MENEKKTRKFNVVDLIVIIIIVAVIAIVAWKFLGNKAQTLESSSYTMEITEEEIPTSVAEQIKEGDTVCLNDDGSTIGTVTKVIVGDAISYANDSEGNYVQSSKPGYSSIVIEVSCTGSRGTTGVKVSGQDYFSGETNTFRVGITKIYAKITNITEAK